MATENFEAVIAANIRDFQRAMQQVDQQIRDAALGANAPIDANISDFMAQMSQVDAQLAQLANNHVVDLDADIAPFRREMRDVNRLLDDVSTGVIADIGAHTMDFEAAMRTVNQQLSTVAVGASADIDANIQEFNRGMRDVERRMRVAEAGANPVISADIARFLAEMAIVDAQLAETARRHNVIIVADVDTSNVETRLARLRRQLNERIVIPVRTSWRNYQNTMGQIASFSRNMSEIMAMTARGIMISISPAIVPIIASLVGLLGQLGPMLGTIGGSTFALGSAFATAGIGAAAFGAIAVTNLKDIFGASSDLKKLQEKLDDATTLKERTKIMKEMKAIQGSMNAEQTKALSSMGKLKDTWTGIAKGLETKTIQIFTKSLDIFGSVLKSLTPMFTGVTDAVGRLTASMAVTIKSDSMVAFFDYLNTTAGPMLETISKSVGNFIKGFLSMMEAFGPLATETSAGFLKMSEGFATWAAGLGESKKFQAFVDYVSENMPKIKSIFGDAITGVINTFAAFAPSSAGMMTSLQDMMARFKEWSSTLAESEGFKSFITYIQTNGPVVADLIGNITTFIVNLGIALAPMGEKMLGIINSFIAWSGALLENEPLMGKIIAAVVVFGGVFLAALPHVLGIVSAIGTLTTPIGAAQVSMISMAGTFIKNMATMVASTVTSVATVIANWVKMAASATLNGAKMAAGWVLATGQKMVTAVASMATTAATFVAKWLLIGAKAMLHAGKVAAAWALSTGKKMVTALASMVATSAKFVAKWLWMGVQSLLHAGKMAAAWFIALGPVGWVIAAIVGLAILIIANWDKIKAATIKIWTSVSDAVKDAWETVKTKTGEALTEVVKIIAKMPGKVKEFATDMISAGGDLIMGLVKGITDMASKALDAITGVVDSVVGKAKSLLKIKSPSRVFLGIGEFAGLGLAYGITSTEAANAKAISGVTKVLTAAALTNAKEVEKISTDAEKKRTAIQKEYAAKRAELDRKSNQMSNSALKTHKNKKGQIVTTGTQRVYNIRADASARLTQLNADEQKKLSAINSKAWADMTKKEAEVSKSRLEAAKTYIDDKKSLDQLSLVAESEIWRKSIVLFKEGTKERVEAQRNYSKAVAAVNQEIISINKEYSDKMMEINNNLKAQEEDLTKTYETSLSDRTNSLRNFAGIFDEVDTAVKDSGSKLLSNLEGQVDAFKLWQQQIDILSSKAINDGLLAELREMGPSALPELLALNSLTDTELTKYSNLYQEKSKLAREQAEAEMAPMKANMEKRINDLRSVANGELEKLRGDWTTKIQGITKATDTELKTLKTVGVNAAKGLEEGLLSMESTLVGTATSIANSVAVAMRSALQVKSPSRVMMEIGRFVSEGLAIGIADEAKSVIRAVVNMATGVTNAFNPQLAMPLMDLKMAPLDTSSQVESLKRQIKQELSVDMSVNHRGGTGGTGGGFNQEVHLHSPTALSPSDNARELSRVGRQQAMEWSMA